MLRFARSSQSGAPTGARALRLPLNRNTAVPRPQSRNPATPHFRDPALPRPATRDELKNPHPH
ncbi:hypothetical protein GCM10027360_14940 [Amycolatopsis echigonensis]